MRLDKPEFTQAMVEDVLWKHVGRPVEAVAEAAVNGNFSKVYHFTSDGADYVILFNHAEDSDEGRRWFIADLLSSQGVRYAKMLGQGEVDRYGYCILERRIPGHVFADCSPEAPAQPR